MITNTRPFLGTVTVSSFATPSRLQINTLDGDDAVTVDVTNGLLVQPVTYDGGAGHDTLTVTGTPPGGTGLDEVIYTPGPSVGAGRLRYENPANAELMRLDFVNLEPVVDLVPAPTLTINAPASDNAINYTQGSVAANGLVSVDNHELIEFSNKTALVLNAGAGSDTINLNNPATPTGLTGITVNGGDPTASDTLIVNGTTGADAINVAPTAADAATITGAGPMPITATTIEHSDHQRSGRR